MCAPGREVKRRNSNISPLAAANWLKVRAITWCGLVSRDVCMPVSHGGGEWIHKSLACVCIYIHACGSSSTAVLAASCVSLMCACVWNVSTPLKTAGGNRPWLQACWLVIYVHAMSPLRCTQRAAPHGSFQLYIILSNIWKKLEVIALEWAGVCMDQVVNAVWSLPGHVGSLSNI